MFNIFSVAIRVRSRHFGVLHTPGTLKWDGDNFKQMSSESDVKWREKLIRDDLGHPIKLICSALLDVHNNGGTITFFYGEPVNGFKSSTILCPRQGKLMRTNKFRFAEVRVESIARQRLLLHSIRTSSGYRKFAPAEVMILSSNSSLFYAGKDSRLLPFRKTTISISPLRLAWIRIIFLALSPGSVNSDFFCAGSMEKKRNNKQNRLL